MVDVSLLGTGGTMPTKSRRLASVIFRHNGSCTLIDCGEGTQLSVRECGYAFKSIDRICLTHFHADHCSGLPGLLLSMGNEGRSEPLWIYGPKGTESVVNALRVIAPELPFEVKVFEQDGKICSFSEEDWTISSFPVRHTVPCRGYRMEIKRVGKFDVELAKKNDVPLQVWSKLQHNSDVEYEGKVYTSDMVLGPERKGIRIVYVTDTRPSELISQMAAGADLLICEGMFGDESKKARARESGHMTFSQAAEIARKAGVEKLWLTHFSPSMPSPSMFADNAKKIFPKTVIGKDGLTEEIRFDEE